MIKKYIVLGTLFSLRLGASEQGPEKNMKVAPPPYEESCASDSKSYSDKAIQTDQTIGKLLSSNSSIARKYSAIQAKLEQLDKEACNGDLDSARALDWFKHGLKQKETVIQINQASRKLNKLNLVIDSTYISHYSENNNPQSSFYGESYPRYNNCYIIPDDIYDVLHHSD